MLVGDFLFIFVAKFPAKFFTVLYRKSLEFATNLFEILISDWRREEAQEETAPADGIPQEHNLLDKYMQNGAVWCTFRILHDYRLVLLKIGYM